MGHWVRGWRLVTIPAALVGAMTLAGSALGTPPTGANKKASAFLNTLPAATSAPGPAVPAPAVPQRAVMKPARALLAPRPAAALVAQRGSDVAACGKHFVSPFEGSLTLRSAYRGGQSSGYQFCPQWSTFGPVRGAHRNHWGIDISAPTGTSVRAAADGHVTYAREAGGYGLFARLRFSTATRGKSGTCAGSEEHEIIYAHLVDDGKTSTSSRQVRAGEVIGRVGCTGNARGMCSPSLESHLHVTVQRSNTRAKLDPTTFLGWHVSVPTDRPADWSACGRGH